jgi:hypothetical protein
MRYFAAHARVSGEGASAASVRLLNYRPRAHAIRGVLAPSYLGNMRAAKPRFCP